MKRRHGPCFSFKGPIPGTTSYDSDEAPDVTDPSIHALDRSLADPARAVPETAVREGAVERGERQVLENAYADGRRAARYGRRCLPLVAHSASPFLIAWRRGYDDQRSEDAEVETA